jgi:trans-aconitate methyltransferase
MTSAEHWDAVYAGGGAHSWDQDEPAVAVGLLAAAGVGPTASVLDVGGGDGALAAALIGRGFTDLTVLDISGAGLAAGPARVGPAAARLTWTVADIRSWRPPRTFDVWHDRAVFHFLVDPADRAGYGAALAAGTAQGSLAVVGAFAADGPAHCSGLPVARYGPGPLREVLSEASGLDWALLRTIREEHCTPSGSMQPFIWVALLRAH